MKNILVIGAGGYMGAGIVQACAQAGYQVYVTDLNRAAVEKALGNIAWSVEKLSAKKVIAESPSSVMGRIKIEDGLGIASSADWIIETVPEIEDLKVSIFKQLDSLIKPETPISSNTSTIQIHRMANKTRHPGRIVGVHFFMPIFKVGIVEVIKGDNTSIEVFERACAFVESLGKRPIRVKADIPGFVYNRIFGAACKQAIDLVEKGVITAEEIDLGMRDAYGWQLGPFQMADFGGIDTFVNTHKSYMAAGETELAPTGNLLEEMMKKGHLGRKTGKGFYDYSDTKDSHK